MASSLNLPIEDLAKDYVTSDTEIPELHPTIKIGESIFAAKGQLSVLAGKTGAGKTSYLTLIMCQASMEQKPEGFDTLGFDVPYCEGKKILYFSFEDGLIGIGRVRDKIYQYLGVEKLPEHIKLINLMDYDRDTRLKRFKAHLNHHGEKAYMCIIDGHQFLVGDINNLNACNLLLDYLKKQANKYQITILIGSHENFNNDKVRGHLGSETEHASAGTVSCSYDRKKGIYIMEGKKFRFSGFPEPMAFVYCTTKNRFVTAEGPEAQSAILSVNKKAQKKNRLNNTFKKYLSNGEPTKKSLLASKIEKSEGVSKKTGFNWIKDGLEMSILTEQADGKVVLAENDESPNNTK